MVVIVDILNANYVLIDGPAFPRVTYPLKRLTLTKLRLPLLRGARTGTMAKAAKKYGLEEKWTATPAYKKMERFNKKSATTDFDRFNIMINRKQRNYAAKKLAKKMK